MEANFGLLAAPRPAIEFLFWDHWETAVFAQILATSLLEANFCHLAVPRPAIEFLFWDHRETAVFAQILAASLLEANFCHLAAPRPAIEFLFWDHWETAVFAQILAGSLLEAYSAIWRSLDRLLNFSSGIIGKRPFLPKSWPGSLLEAYFCHLAVPPPAIEFLFWDHWETNPGREPFGSIFLPFGGPSTGY